MRRYSLIRLTGVGALLGAALLAACLLRFGPASPAQERHPAGPAEDYSTLVRPLLQKYCLGCHSTRAKKGSLDLERFATLADLRSDLKPWQTLLEQVEAGEMPPANRPQPTAEEKARLLTRVRGFLDAEARARAGDPGHVPLRRLSNAEYDYTIRDLTGVDLRPTREFPADGAAGEGFSNAAEALGDISPALLTKYVQAARQVAEHAVLLPDGFRFSPSKTRRDWTDEGTAKLRAFYARHVGGDGRLPVEPYLSAAVRHRAALLSGQVTTKDVAARERLNPNYLGVLWQALTDKTPAYPLDVLQARWRTAKETDIPLLVKEVAGLQAALWRTVKVGNYVQASWNGADGYRESLTRQVPVDPPAATSVPLRLALKPDPGETDVTLLLVTDEAEGKEARVVWHRPRFEAAGKPPLLLRDYADYGPAFAVDPPSLFVGAARYLAAAAESAGESGGTADPIASKHKLDKTLLGRWVELAALPSKRADAETMPLPATSLHLLDDRVQRDGGKAAINGWRKRGTDLPVLVTNASDTTEQIPGRVSPHGVAMHPTPGEFVAVAWTSPVAATVRVTGRVTHAHPACGNGVAWWLEHRRGDRAAARGEGTVDLGKEARPPVRTLKVDKGDILVLAVEARDGNHVCDLTEVGLTITEVDRPGRTWDLAGDVADSVHAGNPHADRQGNAAVWRFVRGAARGVKGGTVAHVPPDSALARWREAAADPKRQAEAAKRAAEVEALLSGPRPAKDGPDRLLHDRLVAIDGPLFAGVDVVRLGKRRSGSYAISKDKFGPGGDVQAVDDASLVATGKMVLEMRLPAALFASREFVVEARLADAPGERAVRVFALPGQGAPRDASTPVLAAPGSAGYRRLLQGYADFRRLFPLYTCFPPVVPTDEVVTLKMFHREDEPLARLFLAADEARQLDRLWAEQRFVSRQPVAEHDYLPQFMGYTTQDTPKAFQQFFVDRKPLFMKHADEFLREEEAAIPRQRDALLDFAARAYRRPLREEEKADLLKLYQTIRGKGAAHPEALRGVLTRVLVSPHFLMRIEQAPPGKAPGPVNDWELATRLSYFLWASAPDDELRGLAAAGRLRDPAVLVGQARRMLADDRLRALAVEFGTQWIHVRGFDELKEKNEALFPTFDATLRKAMYEETILFFQDLFQNDRSVADLLGADHTFLNETLARHYGIPGVQGSHWRRVEGVRRHGRGGIPGMASVLTRQAGASRTSPILRGNWVVETLLGEKLPRPPANVPQLPEEEQRETLTMRQLVERHVKDPACAPCHRRIDPFGFALEAYDPIGRKRDHDLGGRPIDTRARLQDGSTFEGLDGLRQYLTTKKHDVVVRLFCRRLLGYALGRQVTLSDTALLDEMVAELKRSRGRVTAAVETIVRSRQFRMIRGSTFGE